MLQVDLSVRNLIFDLGGVIIDLSVEQTVIEFSRLFKRPATEIQEAYLNHPTFHLYEKGLITSEEFRDFLRSFFSVKVSDMELDRCWNAMIIALPKTKLELLTHLKKQFRVSLLSNTNEIHLDYVNSVMLSGGSLDDYFHSSHYSHLIHMRKPDHEIYEEVLRLNEFNAAETLFMDDNVANVERAKEVGIQTIHIKHPDDVLNLFKAYV